MATFIAIVAAVAVVGSIVYLINRKRAAGNIPRGGRGGNTSRPK